MPAPWLLVYVAAGWQAIFHALTSYECDSVFIPVDPLPVDLPNATITGSWEATATVAPALNTPLLACWLLLLLSLLSGAVLVFSCLAAVRRRLRHRRTSFSLSAILTVLDVAPVAPAPPALPAPLSLSAVMTVLDEAPVTPAPPAPLSLTAVMTVLDEAPVAPAPPAPLSFSPIVGVSTEPVDPPPPPPAAAFTFSPIVGVSTEPTEPSPPAPRASWGFSPIVAVATAPVEPPAAAPPAASPPAAAPPVPWGLSAIAEATNEPVSPSPSVPVTPSPLPVVGLPAPSAANTAASLDPEDAEQSAPREGKRRSRRSGATPGRLTRCARCTWACPMCWRRKGRIHGEPHILVGYSARPDNVVGFPTYEPCAFAGCGHPCPACGMGCPDVVPHQGEGDYMGGFLAPQDVSISRTSCVHVHGIDGTHTRLTHQSHRRPQRKRWDYSHGLDINVWGVSVRGLDDPAPRERHQGPQRHALGVPPASPRVVRRRQGARLLVRGASCRPCSGVVVAVRSTSGLGRGGSQDKSMF
ncbi:hypothetical protein NA57DRAFT_52361 [Rhizodiscina lignyota]|uniref:Uncharacterized protein n=1 Tax=Rhizodiscina lignyota TaxID=1504668 RepID=A0A9P4IKH0_9PEZI|nr:hypothetical protein NA57DRAFT_52361 [Rhizodiscina lignyota]